MAFLGKKRKKKPKSKGPIQLCINDHFINAVFDWTQQIYVFIGGYGSSKSDNAFTKVILKCLDEPGRVVLVVRRHKTSLRNSSYSLSKKIIKRMNAEHLVTFFDSRLEAVFRNGSRIIYTGIDDPEKIKSVDDVSIVVCEEASEISYAVFSELLGRIRHMSFSNHFVLMSNPVGFGNWLYKHFFKRKVKGDDGEERVEVILDDERLYKEREIIQNNVYYHHSVVDDNAFVPEDYKQRLEDMKNYDPDKYRIGRLGRFGLTGTRVLPQFKKKTPAQMKKLMQDKKLSYYSGLDFGFITSYNAYVYVAVDMKNMDLYILEEYYSKDKTNDQIADDLEDVKHRLITADSAEPKTIAYLKKRGFKIRKCKKFQGSKLANIKKVKMFKNIYCSTACKNVVEELEELAYKEDKDGNILEDQLSIDAHTLDAIAYSLDKVKLVDIKHQCKVTKKDLGL